jgi:hypothetical protein
MPKLNHWNHCTAQARDGSFCDAATIEDAPFPICIEHAAAVLQFLRGYIEYFESAPLELRLLALDKTHVVEKNEAKMAEKQRAPHELIYYLQVGALIKIGYTARLKQRLAAYPPDSRLLAFEPGNMGLEERRHRQFSAHLKHGKEWFKPAPELIEHINKLRKLAKSPPLRGVA